MVSTLGQLMGLHTLDGLKGWPQPHAVDFTTTFSPNVAFTSGLPVYSGRVVHLNSAGQYEMGCSGTQMPLFLFPGSTDPDVQNNGGDPTSLVGVYVAIKPSGEAVSLVAIGAYELLSTEYDNTKSYPPNTLLTAGTSNTDSTSGGVLTTGTLATNCICGVVSRGVMTNQLGQNALAFWPVYIPAGV